MSVVACMPVTLNNCNGLSCHELICNYRQSDGMVDEVIRLYSCALVDYDIYLIIFILSLIVLLLVFFATKSLRKRQCFLQ
jgi:hypothetical protein